MSERLETPEIEVTEPVVDAGINEADPWATGERYSYMRVDAGELGTDFYYSLPTFTILVKTKEELDTLNEEISAILSKYTDQIIVGTPHEASLIVSINQAAFDIAQRDEAISLLRNKIHELTGSEEAADS